MIAPRPVATYRLQLRGGLDFDAAAAGLDWPAGLGVSHLYLSPICTAVAGSTHGYDVADPTAIDPALGGEAGFRRLAAAARARGLGLILDLVPNHAALSTENPWIADILRHGRSSRFAAHFDIDWDRGLMLPFLPDPPDQMIEARRLRLTAGDGGRLEWDGGALPLAPGSFPGPTDAPAAVRAALDRQPWRLRHWSRERDSLTHRRFFNITTLIGLRVERPETFDAVMDLPLRLVAEGLAQGLRIDHVDGLADPAGFLARLRARVGPEVPVWVEKILTGDERLPDWPVEGTTGYEAAAAVTAALTPAAGAAAVEALWRRETGADASWEETAFAARRQVLSEDLATELHRVIAAADAAFRAGRGPEPGPEALREAAVAFLCRFPRYRSYATPARAGDGDRAVIEATRDAAAADLRDPSVLDALAALVAAPPGAEAARLQQAVQQTTGALVAKSQEDCAFFRHTALLSACEVGADPGHPAADAAALAAFAARQPPLGMILGSSHDTKRGEDARCRLVACARRPDLLAALLAAAPGGIAPAPRWYAVQSALAMWEPGDGEAPDRLAAHMEKALREAREVTSWPFPDTDAEAPVLDHARRLAAGWQADPPEPLLALVRLGQRISLDHLVLRFLLPGVPDLYQGSECGNFRLTDPDNRPLWVPGDLRRRAASGFAARKLDWTRRLIDLRRRHPDLFAEGAFTCSGDPEAGLVAERRLGGLAITARMAPEGDEPELHLEGT